MSKMFTTPSDIPEGVACRTLKIPNDGIWLGIFNAALLETVNQYNWEQIEETDLTIDQAIEVCDAVIHDYWLSTDNCAPSGCTLPTGGALFRIGFDGHYQQLVDGEWVEPTGDSEVPPVPPRGEATVEERRCSAAANAANVLALTYEAVSDAVNEGLTQAEVLAIFIATITLYVGSWIALPLTALIEILLALFIAFLEIAQFMTADLWTPDFTALLVCVFEGCTNTDGDVVTFDFECINTNLASGVDLFAPDALNQLRLFGQVSFMLSVIGVDGLNAAGATTEITGADCASCDYWCYRFNFEDDDGGFEAPFCGVYTPGVGWQTGYFNDGTSGYRLLEIVKNFSAADLTTIQVYYTLTAGTIYPPAQNYIYRDTGAPGNRVRVWGLYATGEYVETWTGAMNEDNAGVVIYSGFNAPSITDPGGQVTIKRITFRGSGTNPFGSDNC